MKKFLKTLLFTTVLAASTFSASAVKTSYRGFVDFGPALTISNSQTNKFDLKLSDFYATLTAPLSTTHGVQLSRSFFVGAGVAFVFADNSAPSFIPIYASVRWDLNIASKVTPFVSCNLGTYFPFNHTELGEHDGLHFTTSSGESITLPARLKSWVFYYQPTVGVRFRLHHHIGLNVGFTLIPTTYEIGRDYFRDEYDGASFKFLNLGLNIGLDF